ncbi:MAG: hypothetical protein R2710_03355 [Acidimicrobiales bacterium]
MSQARLGAVMTQLAATRANWDRAIARLAAVPTAGPLTLEERVDLRLAAAYTVRSVRELIGSIGEGSGASVYFADSPFQRLQRRRGAEGARDLRLGPGDADRRPGGTGHRTRPGGHGVGGDGEWRECGPGEHESTGRASVARRPPAGAEPVGQVEIMQAALDAFALADSTRCRFAISTRRSA